MLVFSAIAPHPLPLIPTIGKENIKKLAKTAEAFSALERELYVTRPDTLMIISPHGKALPDAFSINLSSSYTVSFKEFGDHKTSAAFRSDFLLIDRVQRALRHDTQLVLTSEEVVDYGIGVPLLLLAAHLPAAAVVPVVTSGLGLKDHFEFGRKLKDEIMSTNKRVAVIASADLSHTLSSQAPAGFNKKGAELDHKVTELLTEKNTVGLLNLEAEMVAASKTCGLSAIMVLLGIMDGVSYDPKILSYEGPFGIGYLVANLVLA